MAKKLEQELEQWIKDILSDEMELVDLEYVKEGPYFYLRVFIDREGGLDIEDITDVTRKINALLDEKDPIEEQYFLEVSSPGLDRALKKEKDFVREKGKEVEIKLYRPKDGKKQYEGKLVGIDEKNCIVIESDGETVTFDRKEIAVVKLKVNFS